MRVRCLKDDLGRKLHSNKYVYIQGKGTTDALVYSITVWVRKLDSQDTLAVHAVFLDFSKAFDIMRFDLLVGKLKKRL